MRWQPPLIEQFGLHELSQRLLQRYLVLRRYCPQQLV